ncbi:UTRA domain-containing protein [Rhodococcus baikonurensis]|uniref:UTRA domain-containing protein n=1 Tax=Rhodococcus baikonurensis TaxID=172041 RepID=UPI00366C284F
MLELTLPSLQWSSSWCFRQCRPPTPTRAAPPHFAEHGRHDQTETLVKITDFDTDRDAAEALGVPGPFIQVVTLVRTGGQPFMVCRYWLEARRFPNFTALITERVALFEVLQERYGLRLRHSWRSLAATLADTEDAALLDLPAGSPVMLRDGVNIDDALAPTMYLRRRLRGDRIRFTMRYEQTDPPTNRTRRPEAVFRQEEALQAPRSDSIGRHEVACVK